MRDGVPTAKLMAKWVLFSEYPQPYRQHLHPLAKAGRFPTTPPVRARSSVWIERQPPKLEVVGSNPIGHAIFGIVL